MHWGWGHTAITQITLTKTFLTLISVHPRSLTNDDTETCAVAYQLWVETVINYIIKGQ